MAVHEPLSPEDERLLPLVVAIADGSPVAWPPVGTPLVQQLQHLERLVRGHDAVRSSASSAARSHETLLTETRRRNAGGSEALRVQWGSLIVFEKIGRGSFGDVYRAWDPRLDREVALKLIPEDMPAPATSPVIEEGRLLARVRHPNVMTVYGADRCDGRTGIWTEYIRGETVAAEVARRGPLPANEAVRIGIDVCAALGAVHAAGMLHRDVKAQNILRDTGGRIVLGDFGTGIALADDARMSDPQIAGTPLYLAPEVIEGTPATIVSDIYGVGVLLYFLLTVTFPVRGSTLAEIRAAHARGARVPLREACPDVPDALAGIVDRLLATNPDVRYQDAAAAEVALRGTLPHSATGQGRGRRLALAAIVGACVLASLAGVGWRQGWPGTMHSRPNAAPVALKAGDWIVVSEFANHTGESVLDGTLRTAVERELEYSDFVRVAQRDRIEDALKLLQRPFDSPLTRDLAVELALRDGGLRAVMAGGITKDPNGYALRFDVIDPATRTPVTTLDDRAATLAEILPRVRAQTLRVRAALGEPTSSIERSREAFGRSALPTLKAMSLATQVRTMVNLRPMRPVSTWVALEEIGRRIMQEDGSFAYGPLVVAWSLSHQGRRPEGVVHAERALHLADNATPQERYFILGTVHGFRGRGDEGPGTVIERGEIEKAVAAFEALFALQPDHYAVRNNLRTVYRLLGRDRDIAWMNQRLADARPWSVSENLEVARQLWRDGNVEGARRYGARAESALSPASSAPDVDAAASVRLFGAYIAWAQDDPHATIQALDRVAASAGTLAPPERRQLAVRLAALYAAVGRLQDAERVLDAAQPPDQNDFTSVMAFAIARAALYEDQADLMRLREFAATRWRDPLPPEAPAFSARRVPFLIELGLLDDAERDLEWFKRRTAQTSEWAPALPRRQFQPFEASTRAAISLKRGRAAEAVAVLRQQMPLLRAAPPWVFGLGGWHTQYAAAKLAEGLEAVGKGPEAIAMLEEAMRDRVALTIGNTPHRWLRANAELAGLYRKSGQEAKAREIETRLSKLLTLADAGHPLALELKSRR